VQVLSLHLTRMGLTSAGGVKDSSDVRFDEHLRLPASVLADGLWHVDSRYQLAATILHKGAGYKRSAFEGSALLVHCNNA
jgi:hypothetical protein